MQTKLRVVEKLIKVNYMYCTDMTSKLNLDFAREQMQERRDTEYSKCRNSKQKFQGVSFR